MKSFSIAQFLMVVSLPWAAGCGGAMSPADQTGYPAVTLSGSISSTIVVKGDALVTGDITVEAGTTLTLSGPNVKVSAGKNIIVKGTLVVSGTTATPVKFGPDGGQDTPGYWGGLTLAGVGTVTLAYAEIHAAGLAFSAMGSGTYSLDHLLIDSSQAALILNSSGSITKTTVHCLGSAQSMSPVQVSGASPHLTDVLVDQAHHGVDLVVVSGSSSSPQFDHVDISTSHCGFHVNDGSNIVISNSNIHDNVYALMAEAATKTTVVLDNIYNNSAVNIGACSAPGSVSISGNYYGGSVTAPFDASCSGNPADPSPSPSKLPSAGVRP